MYIYKYCITRLRKYISKCYIKYILVIILLLNLQTLDFLYIL